MTDWPTTLRSAGEALYGPRWQSAVARDLGVDRRTIRRWLDGSNSPRVGIREAATAILTARIALHGQARQKALYGLRRLS